MPTAITTSTAATATAYSNQRKVDRTSNGVLWSSYLYYSANYPFVGVRYSLDNGATWADGGAAGVVNGSNSSSTATTYTPNFSFFIDQDDYAHLVYKHNNDGYIYYRRGTPNAARTAWTWSAATLVVGSASYDYPDIVAHREGSGWSVHIVASLIYGTTSDRVRHFYASVASDGSLTSAFVGYTDVSVNYGNTVHKWPSVDFNHTGDGKTVAGGTPHLYVAWSAGAAGAGKGIRFRKATYSAGSWTWDTEREIDSTTYVNSAAYFLNCLFDGTRIVLPGFVYTGSDSVTVLHEVTTDGASITARTLATGMGGNGQPALYYGSSAHTVDGDVHFFGRSSGGTAGQDNWPLVHRTWTRSTSTFSGEAVMARTGSAAYSSAARRDAAGRIEFIYTDGTASPYEVKYSFVGDEPELYPAPITTSSASTATAYSNQRKIDRTSNGVLWALYVWTSGADTSPVSMRYSTDDGATWASTGVAIGNGSGATANNYAVNASFFIDADDYCHLVFKDNSNGYIYYRRGTPNASRTAWTWSAAQTVFANVYMDVPDVVAHREGTGWVVHTVRSFAYNGNNYAYHRPLTIAADGTVTVGTDTTIGGSYGNSTHTYPSVDFHHTGDGKTVAGGTPHLYVAWSAGAAGAGKGIRFRKATYSAGSWTWGTEREIDSTRYVSTGSAHWLNCLFDGTRVILPGALYDGTNNDVVLHERDAADTTTTARVLIDNAATTAGMWSGSSAYDSAGNVYLFGRNNSTSFTTAYRKWTRGTATFEASVVIDSSTSSAPYVSAKRGYSNQRIEFIYTDGTASPYTVTYSTVVLPPAGRTHQMML